MRKKSDWIYFALLASILIVYSQVGSHAFVDYDDPQYVVDNPHVRDGFSWGWAFTSTEQFNWFPLTWLSHMLDCQLFGLDAGLHHWTNVILHATSTLLLFGLLKRMTGARWASAFVAFAFGLHPLHVESVAWIAERKDVLSTLFWFLTIWAYLNYVERPGPVRYLIVMAAFACGLMSKPMIVTLPFALMLLDYWPLKRFNLIEKIPLIAMAMGASLITFIAQKQGGAVAVLDRVPVAARLENALITYIVYVAKFVFPTHLAVFYPYLSAFSWQWILAGLALLAMTVFVVVERRRRPYLAVGWLWYVGTLVPVIGLVQVGAQSRADRYTYIPTIGISIMIAWAAAELIQNRRVLAWAGGAVAAMWCVLTWQNLTYWQNSETLFLHAIEVTDQNFVAYNNLGGVRRRQGRIEDAVLDFESAVKIQPESPEALDNLGEALTTEGKVDEAIPHLMEAVRVQPGFSKAHVDLGSALMRGGRTEEAAAQFREALRLDPENRDADYRLGGVLAAQGRMQEALPHFERALPGLIDMVRRNPEDVDNHYNLGGVYGMMGRASEAAGEFSTVVRLRPQDPEAHFNLGLALAGERKLEEAAEQFAAAARIRPDYVNAHLNLARMLAAMGRKTEAAAEYSETLRLVPGFSQASNELRSLQGR